MWGRGHASDYAPPGSTLPMQGALHCCVGQHLREVTEMTDQFNLERFAKAQEPVFNTVLNELRAGRKKPHGKTQELLESVLQRLGFLL